MVYCKPRQPLICFHIQTRGADDRSAEREPAALNPEPDPDNTGGGMFTVFVRSICAQNALCVNAKPLHDIVEGLFDFTQG